MARALAEPVALTIAALGQQVTFPALSRVVPGLDGNHPLADLALG
jgi:hypothetical protein